MWPPTCAAAVNSPIVAVESMQTLPLFKADRRSGAVVLIAWTISAPADCWKMPVVQEEFRLVHGAIGSYMGQVHDSTFGDPGIRAVYPPEMWRRWDSPVTWRQLHIMPSSLAGAETINKILVWSGNPVAQQALDFNMVAFTAYPIPWKLSSPVDGESCLVYSDISSSWLRGDIFITS